MANIQIQTHNFEGAKTEICKMAQNAPRSTRFTRVETEGTGLGGFLFGTNHNVTGSELNNLIREVQNAFSVVHQNTQLIHGALYQVYNAFESLDDDYIKFILKNLEATKVAANTAQKTADALAASLPKIKDKIAESERKMQYEIDKTKTMANETANAMSMAIQNVKEQMSNSERQVQMVADDVKRSANDSERRMQMEIDNLKRNIGPSAGGSSVLLYVLASVSTVVSIAALLVAILK